MTTVSLSFDIQREGSFQLKAADKKLTLVVEQEGAIVATQTLTNTNDLWKYIPSKYAQALAGRERYEPATSWTIPFSQFRPPLWLQKFNDETENLPSLEAFKAFGKAVREAHGVEGIWLYYSGSGDEGQINSTFYLSAAGIVDIEEADDEGYFEATDNKTEHQPSDTETVSELDLIHEWANDILPDYYNNDGGYGVLYLITATGKIVNHHNAYYTETHSETTEF